jgi:hypothetical protein
MLMMPGSANVDHMIQEAVNKMSAELKSLGFDPLIDLDQNRVGIILPVEQLVNRISKNIPNMVYRHLDISIEEKTLGTKGFIVIKIRKKQ